MSSRTAERREQRRSVSAGRERWVALVGGVFLAVATLYVLGSGERPDVPREPLDQIDDASRARLAEVLRHAERDERRRP